jgi:tellurite resistance-related uncharacterized protein
VIRSIEGFFEDEDGDWVAELSCLHRQHVRHQPPFRDRPWVETSAGRHAHVGADLDCPLCDRAELPDDLDVVRTAGPFEEGTVPVGLRRRHRVADRTWGLLRVLQGAVGFRLETDPPSDLHVAAGEAQPIPPGVDHHVLVEGPVRLVVDFLARPHSAAR